MDISTECVDKNLSQLIKAASDYGNFIRIDMENSSTTDATIDIYKKFKKKCDQIGIVFQAYLFRTENDIKALIDETGLNIRICKGIYSESQDVAIQDRQGINNNFHEGITWKSLIMGLKKSIQMKYQTFARRNCFT